MGSTGVHRRRRASQGHAWWGGGGHALQEGACVAGGCA